MADIKLHSVPNVAPQRPAERTQPQQRPADPRAFEQTLQNTMRELDGVTAAKTPGATVQDELRQTQEQFNKMMEAEQAMRRLYLNIQKPEKA